MVAQCANLAHAGMVAGELSGAGIIAQVIDQNTEALGPYAPGSDVKVVVLMEDAGRAKEVLELIDSDEVEPAEEPANAPPPADEMGLPVRLAVAAAFDNPPAARRRHAPCRVALRPFLPALVARGERPAGEGRRFLLRVREEDLERAEAVLEEAEAGDEDEPRCPRCRSWRVFRQTSLLGEVGRFFGFGRSTPPRYECLACRHLGGEAEFRGRRD